MLVPILGHAAAASRIEPNHQAQLAFASSASVHTRLGLALIAHFLLSYQVHLAAAAAVRQISGPWHQHAFDTGHERNRLRWRKIV